MSFCVWSISLSIVSSGHVVVSVRISSLFKGQIIFHDMYMLLFVYLFVCRHVSCFYFSLQSNAAVNISVHISV